VLKAAVLPRSGGDVDRLMGFCEKLSGRRAFIAMGSLGRRTRLAPSRWGSCLTYGYLTHPTAPGQASVRALAKAVRKK
jgi:3-dehydroquinate dehydratase I